MRDLENTSENHDGKNITSANPNNWFQPTCRNMFLILLSPTDIMGLVEWNTSVIVSVSVNNAYEVTLEQLLMYNRCMLEELFKK